MSLAPGVRLGPYVIVAFLEGESLAARVQRGPLPAGDVARLELDRGAETQITSESGTESMLLWENGPVSTGAAAVPRWSRDGRELFFISMVSDESHLVQVPMRLAPSLEIGKPERLLSFPPGRRWADYEPVPDGRFLAIQFVQFRGLQPVTVIANWRASPGR